ncbi:hypothetical protein A4A49_62050, partial [Nicotiana attenuata]
PHNEGGVGFKKLQDFCNSFAAKKWWRFRVKNNLWTRFLNAKYCPRSNPLSKIHVPKDSNSWRNLRSTRDIIDSHIFWNIHEGNNLFWVCEFIHNQAWYMEKLQDIVNQYILSEISQISMGLKFSKMEIVRQHNIKVIHCYRGGNGVADLLFKHASSLTRSVIYTNENDLPPEIRDSIRVDRMQVPAFRLKGKRHSGWYFEPP